MFCFVLLVLGQSDIGCFRILACISHVTIPEKDARGQHKAAKPAVWEAGAGGGGGKPQQAPLALGSGPCFRPTKIPQLAFRITHAFVCGSVSLYRQEFSVKVCKLGAAYPIPQLDSEEGSQK